MRCTPEWSSEAESQSTVMVLASVPFMLDLSRHIHCEVTVTVVCDGVFTSAHSFLRDEDTRTHTHKLMLFTVNCFPQFPDLCHPNEFGVFNITADYDIHFDVGSRISR